MLVAMSSGIASLHKILKDETRRQIVLLLNEKNSMGYTELMDTLGIVSTGTLNYHLKVLGDLLLKNENGQYTLTERGKLASRLLVEFPEQDNQAERRKWTRRFFITLALGQVVYFSTILTLYHLGYVDGYRVLTTTSWVVIGTIALYFGYRMQRTIPAPGSKEEKARMKISYVLGGIFFGLLTAFFGVLVLSRLISDLSGNPFSPGNPLYDTLWSRWYMFFSMLIAPAIGGIAGYYLGKKRGFPKPKWAVWLDSHF